MSYVVIPTRSSTDTNSSADINQLNDNCEFLKAVTTPIALSVGGVLASSGDAFKNVNGFTYTWHGSDLTIKDIRAVQGTADTGATQGYTTLFVSGSNRTPLDSSLSLSATDDTYVQGTLSGTPANLSIESGDTIKVFYYPGTNGDAANLCVFIYCEVT